MSSAGGPASNGFASGSNSTVPVNPRVTRAAADFIQALAPVDMNAIIGGGLRSGVDYEDRVCEAVSAITTPLPVTEKDPKHNVYHIMWGKNRDELARRLHENPAHATAVLLAARAEAAIDWKTWMNDGHPPEHHPPLLPGARKPRIPRQRHRKGRARRHRHQGAMMNRTSKEETMGGLIDRRRQDDQRDVPVVPRAPGQVACMADQRTRSERAGARGSGALPVRTRWTVGGATPGRSGIGAPVPRSLTRMAATRVLVMLLWS